MSKNNNVNPDFYKDGDRNRQGDGILHDDEKRQLNQNRPSQGKEGDPNFIPGEAPAGQRKDDDRE